MIQDEVIPEGGGDNHDGLRYLYMDSMIHEIINREGGNKQINKCEYQVERNLHMKRKATVVTVFEYNVFVECKPYNKTNTKTDCASIASL